MGITDSSHKGPVMQSFFCVLTLTVEQKNGVIGDGGRYDAQMTKLHVIW